METLQRLGLDKHQYYIVAHNETDHIHLHVVANLTNPENGQRVTPSFDKRELQKWALEYEREHGLYCEMRVENAAKRERGEHVKYKDTKQDYSERVTRAFYAADSGKAFVNSLESEGLHLAQGRRGGFVIVDESGDIQKLGRQLEIEQRGKEKTAVIKVLLEDIQATNLQDAEEIAAQIKAANQERERDNKTAAKIEQKDAPQPEIFNRDQYEAEQQERIDLAGITHTDEQAVIAKEVKKLEIPRFVRLKEIRAENAELKDTQSKENAALAVRLRKEANAKEKAHRAEHQGRIDMATAKKKTVVQELEKKGVGGFVHRLRWGAEMREEIENLDKNIANAKMRRDEGVGHLSRYDKARLAILNKTHQEQRENLRSEQREDLQAIEDSRAEKEQELLSQAQATPSNAGEIKSAVDTRSKQGKAQLSKIEHIEQSHKAERETAAPDDGRREHDHLAGGKSMSKGKSSLEEWRDIAGFAEAAAAGARAQQQNISIEELRENEEAQRQENMFDAGEPERLEANKQEQLAQMREEFAQPAQERGGWFPHRDNEEERAEQLAEYQEELEDLGYNEEQRQEILAEMEQEHLQGLEQDHGIER